MSVDWEARGLLAGLDDEAARSSRRRLLEDLAADGVPLAELEQAVAEDRLTLLPVERVLSGPGERYTLRELAERSGVPLERLVSFRRALGLPIPEPEERVFTEEDLTAAKLDRRFEGAGLPEEGRLEVARVIGRSMAGVAAAMRDLTAKAIARPGDTEHELGLRYADAARAAVPSFGTLLENVLSSHLRDQIRQDVIAQADLASGEVRGSVEVGVCFADLVGFTRLGESVEHEELEAVIERLGTLAAEVAEPPVQLVKMIGDAAMLVSREPAAVLEAALTLVDAAAAEGDGFPELRAGVALGEALTRGGDYYGRPVNLASRLTAIARRASVLAAEELRDALADSYRFSFAGKKRIKGLKGEAAVFRVRRPSEEQARSADGVR